MKLFKRWFGRTEESETDVVLDVEQSQRAARPKVTPLIPGKRDGDAGDSLPRFRVSAIGRPMVAMEKMEFTVARMRLREAFTPAQPVTDRNMFAGRNKVLSTLIEIIEERLSHVVIFGERGMGKTSLLHILDGLAQESRYLVLRGTCGANSQFDDIFRTMLEDVPLLYSTSISPTDRDDLAGRSLAELLPERGCDSRQLSEILSEITGTRILILLDEYDRLQSEQFRQSVAELIKNLSDRAAPVQLVIAGVSSNLHELIGYIPSIRRNVIGVPIPRLTHDEVQSIVNIGMKTSKLNFDQHVIEIIYALSNGSPYMTRLICHHSSLIALADERMNVTREDVEAALDAMVEEAEGRLSFNTVQRVRKLDVGERGATLGVISRVASTPDGWFTKAELQSQTGPGAKFATAMKLIEGELIAQGLVSEDSSGPEIRYGFTDEGLPNYLWMTVARDQFRTKAKKAA